MLDDFDIYINLEEEYNSMLIECDFCGKETYYQSLMVLNEFNTDNSLLICPHCLNDLLGEKIYD